MGSNISSSLAAEFFVTAFFSIKPGNILWNEERVLPGRWPRRIGVSIARRIKRLEPCASAAMTAHEAGGNIENVLPVLRALAVYVVEFRISSRPGQSRDAGVIVGVFECSAAPDRSFNGTQPSCDTNSCCTRSRSRGVHRCERFRRSHLRSLSGKRPRHPESNGCPIIVPVSGRLAQWEISADPVSWTFEMRQTSADEIVDAIAAQREQRMSARNVSQNES